MNVRMSVQEMRDAIRDPDNLARELPLFLRRWCMLSRSDKSLRGAQSD